MTAFINQLVYRVASVAAVVCCLLTSVAAKGIEMPHAVAVQGLSLAPNAGGQQAYTLRLSNDDYELTVFKNFGASGNRVAKT